MPLYDPRLYRSPHTSNIAELIGRPGQIAAERLRRKGDVRGGIANVAANTIGGLIQYQQDAPKRELAGLQLEAARTQADQGQQQAALEWAAQALPRVTAANYAQFLSEAPKRGLSVEGAPPTFSEEWKKRELSDLSMAMLPPTERQKILNPPPKADYTLGPSRYSGETNQPIATTKPSPPNPVPVQGLGPDGTPGTVFQVPTPGAFVPSAPPKVTFGAPQVQLIDGKRGLVRPGSDAKFYDTTGKEIAEGRVTPLPDTPAKAERMWVKRGDEAVWVTNDQVQPGDQPWRSTAAGDTDSDMPSLYRNAVDRAIMSVPAVRRGTVVTLANRYFREGNLDELKRTVLQSAIEGENVDTKNQVRGREATRMALADTKQMLLDLKAKNVPTGWLTGTAEDLARKLGTSTNPEYVRLGTRLMDTLITYRRAATGVQFSQKETEQYAKMFPNYKQTLPVNLATLDGMLRAIDTNDRVFWEQKLPLDFVELVFGPKTSSGTSNAVPAGVKIQTTVSGP